MYIIQMADLHIGSSIATEPDAANFFLQSAEFIKREIPQNEKILICLCGDIIDSKNLDGDVKEVKRRYDEAQSLIREFVSKINSEYQITVKACPGNHDATHMEEMFEFVKEIDTQYPDIDELKSCYTTEIDGVETKFVFVYSCNGDQYEKGLIDYKALEHELESIGVDEKKVIVLHHTILSMFENDNSSIRNAAKLIHLIDKYNVVGVLHGHIHGREIFSLGKNRCKIIGTGALLSRGNINVNSQFNIIEIKKNSFLKILNCRYCADGGNDPWDAIDINDSENESIFISKKFSKAYKSLIDRLDVETPIDNMRIEIKGSYDEFLQDIREFIGKDKLKIGEKKFSYFDLAEMWQSEEVPKELYFNHGSYFKNGEKSGITFVADELKKKPTSNRIVLSTYSMEQINKSLDDAQYLPSLASIQFGKEGERLIVHMHLRALEAKQFLKINICEIDYLLKKLKQNNVEFSKVEIIISAFRVQKKEGFHCFLKTEIDSMDTIDLTTLVNLGNISDLCLLFREKKDAKETITKVHGIENVYKAMISTNKLATKKGTPPIYEEEIINLLKEALEKYQQLDQIHKSCSIQSADEEEYEKEIEYILERVIEKMEEAKTE